MVFKRLGLGRRTRQFNPEAGGARNLAQWLMAVMSMKGESNQMSVPEAVAMIRRTPPKDRSAYAREIWRRRWSRYPQCGRRQCASPTDEVPF